MRRILLILLLLCICILPATMHNLRKSEQFYGVDTNNGEPDGCALFSDAFQSQAKKSLSDCKIESFNGPKVYTVKPGDTLDRIAANIYGNKCYAKIIALHNRIEDIEKIETGMKLKTPSFDILLSNEGFANVMKHEMAYIVCARELYINTEKNLQAKQTIFSSGKMNVPDEIKETMLTSACYICLAIKGLSEKKAGVSRIPVKMIYQLQKVSTNLIGLASGGREGASKEMDMVHQNLALAMANGIIWSRNGFR